MRGCSRMSKLTSWQRQRAKLGTHLSKDLGMTRILITLTALFASATITAALALFSGWPVAILAGVVAFLATQQVAASFARLKDKRAAQREITALRRVTL